MKVNKIATPRNGLKYFIMQYAHNQKIGAAHAAQLKFRVRS